MSEIRTNRVTEELHSTPKRVFTQIETTLTNTQTNTHTSKHTNTNKHTHTRHTHTHTHRQTFKHKQTLKIWNKKELSAQINPKFSLIHRICVISFGLKQEPKD